MQHTTAMEKADGRERRILAERFPPGVTCDWCFVGAEGHEVVGYNVYREPVIGCIADRERDEARERPIDVGALLESR